MLNSKFCHWYEEVDGAWYTDCEHYTKSVIPLDFKWKYCCYCGKNLIEVTYKEGHDDQKKVHH